VQLLATDYFEELILRLDFQATMMKLICTASVKVKGASNFRAYDDEKIETYFPIGLYQLVKLHLVRFFL
jgi:hypothetical protein